MENEIDQVNDQNQLWVNISSLSEGNVFALLPNILREMLGTDLNDTELDENFQITLPSNYEWRSKNYIKLLDKQKAKEKIIDEDINDDKSMESPLQQHEEPILHHWNIGPIKSERDKRGQECLPDSAHLIRQELSVDGMKVKWSNTDLGKAGCLLCTPPIKVTFIDEEEMRTVYTLIYDVFRYKSVLIQTLDAVGFLGRYVALSHRYSLIWLLLYDLYHREFKERKDSLSGNALKLFEMADLLIIDSALWKYRVKLAASIARIRIKRGALSLNDLLPHHLRDERLMKKIEENPITCWVNIKKLKNPEEVENVIDKHLQLKLIGEKENLTPDYFKWDTHCPQFVLLHPSIRSKLTQSVLVKKHKIIVQDRSFCLGPATFGKLLSDMQLSGSVIQTHVNSPRTTAYLATLLSQNANIRKLMAFSAGTRKPEYDQYFQELGVKNINIFSEKLIDVPTDANYLEEVSAVFATPPNSYTAVSDPIDLVCSRGGDLTMLEVLTESDETNEGKARVAEILDEQRKTLRFVMSRPQIQFVLYETHSELDIENSKMVEKAMKEINKIATIHHANLQGKFAHRVASSETTNKEINNNEKLLKLHNLDENPITSESQISIVERRSSIESIHSTNSLSSIYKNVKVPDTDLFDIPPLPDLCPNSNICTKMANEGCYLAVLQRKQITRMDNKYMIEMAEVRGLFGKNPTTRAKTTAKERAKKQEKPSTPSHNKPRKKGKAIEVDRIAAPTLSSTLHTAKQEEIHECPRCIEESNTTIKDFEKLKSIYEDVNEIEKHWLNYMCDSTSATFSYQRKSLEEDNNVKIIDTISEEEDDANLSKIMPFYNIQNFTTDISQHSIILAPEIKAISPKVSEIFTCQAKIQTDIYFPECTHVPRKKFRKIQKENKEPQTNLKKKRKRLSLDTILKRLTVPTHASITRASQSVNIICKICMKRATRSGLV